MSVKVISVGPEIRKKIDKLVSQAAGTKRAIEAKLDCRYTSKKGVYGAYERYLLSDGHTVFVSLETMKATVSDKPNRYAVAKVERLKRRRAERATRKQEREDKKLRARANRKTPEAKKIRTKVTAKVVKHDPRLATLEA